MAPASAAGETPLIPLVPGLTEVSASHAGGVDYEVFRTLKAIDDECRLLRQARGRIQEVAVNRSSQVAKATPPPRSKAPASPI